MHATSHSFMPQCTLGVSYFGNRNPAHYTRDLREMIDKGCNAVLHTFSENDQRFYKKTIAELVHITREEGLQVGLDPWGVGRVFSGEATSEFALNNRHLCQVYRGGQSVPAACMNNPGFVAFMDNWISDAVELQPDFIFWDEPRFHIVWGDTANPSTQVCWCKHCRSRFAATNDLDFPQENNEVLQLFKKESLLNFVTNLCRQSNKGGLRNALCLLPCETRLSGARDWERFAAIEQLDVIGTSPYWRAYNRSVLPYVAEQSIRVVKLARENNKEAQIWIQSYNIPDGAENEVALAARTAFECGIRNIWAWSYFGNAYMSYNACANPKQVWECLGNTYHCLSDWAQQNKKL